ncbi:SIMPL domain-containing protein [bacterium]|nr:SIMPL domain-containing protein [bacterium]
MYEKFKDFQIAILGISIAIGIIFAAIVSTANLSKDNISVTGSAYEIVKSDSANWTFTIKSKAATRAQAYKIIKSQIPTVKQYLTTKGFKEEQIEIKPVESYETYKTNPSNGYATNVIDYYNYTQPIKVSTDDVEKLKDLTISYQELTDKGINISSYEQPQYHYSELADLKIKLLQSATTDARNRAKSMLKSNHNRLGKIRSAKMGVFQITPVDSNDVSDSGYNDLSSIEKKVTAVANVTFAIK